jgi:hypothetical protein
VWKWYLQGLRATPILLESGLNHLVASAANRLIGH